MLTRLRVSGFKNLVDVDVRFGPFTCIAGANGVGKSNLFDAIRFLSALADRPLINAAWSVRDADGRSTDIRNLFHHIGDDYVDEMSFIAEMIIPPQGFDDLGQSAQASITFVEYTLVLGYQLDQGLGASGKLEIKREELAQINIGDASKKLLFKNHRDWRKSVITGRRITPFISTEGNMINLHQDGPSGRPQRRLASTLPRTVLSATNAAESPTALLVRREMQSWRLLQLEPSALRRSNEFNAPNQLGDDGSNLAATLYELARTHRNSGTGKYDPEQIYAQVAKHLWELIDDVYQVTVDRDDKRELLTLQITDRNQTTHAARALSDGTLRFLALAILKMDPRAQGVICLEEPENGIHPARIPKILGLLQEIAVSTDYPVDDDNPLRQVIINTYSPLVMQLIPQTSLLTAYLVNDRRNGKNYKKLQFKPTDPLTATLTYETPSTN